MTNAPELSATQLESLACVLDEIVPPSRDGRLPGAGELGLANTLAAKAELRPVLAAGVDEVDARARDAGHASIGAAPSEARRALVEASSNEQPAFVPTLVAQTFVAYYQQPAVLDAIGIGAGPLFPRGFEVAETDFSILAPVRERAPFYRLPDRGTD